jgi:hypothetical protein
VLKRVASAMVLRCFSFNGSRARKAVNCIFGILLNTRFPIHSLRLSGQIWDKRFGRLETLLESAA